MKSLIALLLFSSAALAQTVTIPAQTVTLTVSVPYVLPNGTSTTLPGTGSVTIPAQTVALPPSTGLPAGLGYGPFPTVTTVGPSLADSAGNKWSINSSGQVVIGSQSLTSTSNVVEITVVGGNAWQLNKAGNWYEATTVTGTAPSQTVTWGAGTATSPIPPGNFFSVSGGVLATGNVQGNALQLTGGPLVPACSSELFLWQLVNGSIQLYCYTAP
jgi:hypothetical protein